MGSIRRKTSFVYVFVSCELLACSGFEMSPHIGYTFPGLGSASAQDLCDYGGNIYARRSFNNVCRFLSGSFYGQDFYALHTLSDFEIF